MMPLASRWILIAAATAATSLALVAAARSQSPATAADGYLPAVMSDEGMTFPVARSNWYSVINFRDDWHAPRMRFYKGVGWVQDGVHEGNDIFAEPGTPIRAILGGRVENLGWTFYSGWRVGVRGDDGRYWFYAHMRRFGPGIAPRVRVESGTVLGEVGNTGYGAEPGHSNEFTYHLHLGIQEASGEWINPYPLVRDLYRRSLARGS